MTKEISTHSMIVEKGDNMSENSEYQIFPLNKLVPGETAIIVKIDSEIKEHKKPSNQFRLLCPVKK